MSPNVDIGTGKYVLNQESGYRKWYCGRIGPWGYSKSYQNILTKVMSHSKMLICKDTSISK